MAALPGVELDVTAPGAGETPPPPGRSRAGLATAHEDQRPEIRR